jgi:hypothetical protein
MFKFSFEVAHHVRKTESRSAGLGIDVDRKSPKLDQTSRRFEHRRTDRTHQQHFGARLLSQQL